MTYIEPGTLEARQVFDLLTDLLRLAREARHKAQTDRARAGYWHGAAFGFDQAVIAFADHISTKTVHSEEEHS